MGCLRDSYRDWYLRMRSDRERLGYSRQQVADHVFVSVRTYEKWEQGFSEPKNLSTVAKIAAFLGSSLDWWFLDVQSPVSSDSGHLLASVGSLGSDDRRAVLQLVSSLAVKAN